MPATEVISQRSQKRQPLAAGTEWLSGRVFLLLCVAAVAAAFPKVLLGIDTFFDRDFGAICYAQAVYHRDALLHGELPFWNPYNYCGIPFLAQWGDGWYPSFFLNVLFPVPWSVNFFHLLHLVWGGCGMYWLARRWSSSGFAAGFAGIAYIFNGVSLSCLMWPSYTAFFAWSPWVLGCVTAAWRYSGRWIPLAAMCSAMQVLACAPELTILFWALVGFLWVTDVSRSSVRFWLSLGRLFTVVGLAAGITMVQMLPFLDLLAHSQRNANFAGDTWSIPGWGWANLLVPLFHCFRAPRGCWYQPDQHLVCSYYVGAGVLVLAVGCALLKRTRESAIFAGMALFCWIMALGSNGVVFDWVKHIFPWIGIARYPVKFAFFPMFLVPLMAAWMIEHMAEVPGKQPRRMLIVVGSAMLLLMAGIVWFALVYPFSWDDRQATVLNAAMRGLIAVALLIAILWIARMKSGLVRATLQMCCFGLLMLDAFTHNPNLMPTLPVSSLAPGTWQAGVKRSPPALGEGRAMTSSDAAVQLSFNRFSDSFVDFTGKRLAEFQDLNLLDRVPMVGGGVILSPAHFDKLQQFLSRASGPPCEGLLDFLSVQWISSTRNPVLWTARTNSLPVITAGQQPSYAPDDQVLASITADGFDPRETVYLDPSLRSLVSVTNRTNCKILSTRFSSQKIEAQIEAREPSLIVLSQSYYHLWRASVDGRPTPLLRANLAFQALEVPAGRHHIKLLYRDKYFWAGAVISLLFAMLSVSLLLRGWRPMAHRPHRVIQE